MTLHTIAFGVHIISLILACCGILYADHAAYTWFRGTKETLSLGTLRRLHAIVGGALGLLIGSGAILFWPMRAFLLTEPLFLLKIAFVLALVGNSFVIEHLMNRAATKPYRSLSLAQKRPLFISGAVSACCWLGAFAIAVTIF